MRACGGGTSTAASGRVASGGGTTGGNDNINFKSMIEGIFIGKAKPYLLELFMGFLEGDTKPQT